MSTGSASIAARELERGHRVVAVNGAVRRVITTNPYRLVTVVRFEDGGETRFEPDDQVVVVRP